MRAPSRLELIRRALAARRLWPLVRALLIAAGLKRTTPGPGEVMPATLTVVPPASDTGASWRAKWRVQNPATDPEEPGGGESASRGDDHGWSGCTLTSGAVALSYQKHYAGASLAPWGGDLRHSGQPDMEGGTDLYDLRDAWAEYGESLSIRSGQGWGAVKTAHGEGRAVVIQGEGNVPGSATFDGGHACCIGPETNGDGHWLWGDPLVSDWQWVPPGKIEDWAKAWSSGVAFAVSRKPPEEPPPPKPPTPPPVDTTPYDAADLQDARQQGYSAGVVAAGDAGVTDWLGWFREARPTPADRWDAGAWALVDDATGLELAADTGDCPEPGEPAHWTRGPVPQPAADALACLAGNPAWSDSRWRQVTWAG